MENNELGLLSELLLGHNADEVALEDLTPLRNLKNRLVKLCDELSIKTDFVNEHVNIPIRRIAVQKKLPWLKDKSSIGIMGKYASGKTTFINTLIKIGLPRQTNPTTALPTYITYEEQPSYRLLTYKGIIKKCPEVFMHILGDKDKSSFPYAEIFRYLVVGNKSEMLNKINYIDTPGISNDKYDLQIAEATVPLCDIIFWCIKAKKGDIDGEIELPFLEKNIKGKNISLYLVVTGCDRVPKFIKPAIKCIETLKGIGIDVKGVIFYFKGNEKINKFLNDNSMNIRVPQEIRPNYELTKDSLATYKSICSCFAKELKDYTNIDVHVLCGYWKEFNNVEGENSTSNSVLTNLSNLCKTLFRLELNDSSDTNIDYLENILKDDNINTCYPNYMLIKCYNAMLPFGEVHIKNRPLNHLLLTVEKIEEIVRKRGPVDILRG